MFKNLLIDSFFILLCRVGYQLFLYTRGGQLVFDWGRLENFLLVRDRPVDKATTTKCQS